MLTLNLPYKVKIIETKKEEKPMINFSIIIITKNDEEKLKNLAENALAKFPKAVMQFEVQEQYRNMKEILDQYPEVTRNAEEAYSRAGLTVIKEPIRGGTDGSRLSFMGLPCPNIFTGMQAIHSRHEWIGVRDMERAVDVLVELVQVWVETAI